MHGILECNKICKFILTKTIYLAHFTNIFVEFWEFDELLIGDYQDNEYNQQDHQKQRQCDNIMAMDQNPTFSFITTATAPTTELQLNPAVNDGENIALTDNLSHAVYSHTPSQSGNVTTSDANAGTTRKNSDTAGFGHIAQQLYIIRRLIFFLFFIIYIISIPICLF
ncbi:hypothetical protein QQG55_35625 [Brugia pahangi]